LSNVSAYSRTAASPRSRTYTIAVITGSSKVHAVVVIGMVGGAGTPITACSKQVAVEVASETSSGPSDCLRFTGGRRWRSNGVSNSPGCSQITSRPSGRRSAGSSSSMKIVDGIFRIAAIVEIAGRAEESPPGMTQAARESVA